MPLLVYITARLREWGDIVRLLSRDLLIMTGHRYRPNICLVDMISRRPRRQNCSKLDYRLNADKFCTKKKTHWLTSDCKKTGKYGCCEGFSQVISVAFCTETRSYPAVIQSRCLENNNGGRAPGSEFRGR